MRDHAPGHYRSLWKDEQAIGCCEESVGLRSLEMNPRKLGFRISKRRGGENGNAAVVLWRSGIAAWNESKDGVQA